jgi:hypothetical protein
VDQELVEYFDRRFGELREGLRQDLRQELGASLRQELGENFQELGASLRQELRTEFAASTAETRRYFDVVAEQLMDKIQLVGEGVIGVDQKVDRLTTEMRGEFQKVDRRFLHLEARVIAPRG